MMSDDQKSSKDESEFDSDLPGILPSVLMIGAILVSLLFSLEKGCQYNRDTANKIGRMVNVSAKMLFWLPECPANEDADSTKEPWLN